MKSPTITHSQIASSIRNLTTKFNHNTITRKDITVLSDGEYSVTLTWESTDKSIAIYVECYISVKTGHSYLKQVSLKNSKNQEFISYNCHWESPTVGQLYDDGWHYRINKLVRTAIADVFGNDALYDSDLASKIR